MILYLAPSLLLVVDTEAEDLIKLAGTEVLVAALDRVLLEVRALLEGVVILLLYLPLKVITAEQERLALRVQILLVAVEAVQAQQVLLQLLPQGAMEETELHLLFPVAA